MGDIPKRVIEKIREAKEKQLEILDLSWSRLKEIPESITQLQSLTTLDLSDNPIEIPPLEIVEKGIGAIREYYRQLESAGQDYLYEVNRLSEKSFMQLVGIVVKQLPLIGRLARGRKSEEDSSEVEE